jgi:hypothetical protein
MAKCTVCDQELDIRGMRMHMTKHNIEQTSVQTPVQTPIQNSTLEDSNKLNNDLATLSDSIRTKDADIELLNDSIKQKDVEFEQIKAELADAISLEHEQELVRNVFKKLTPEAYVQIGQRLGFLKLEDSGTLQKALSPKTASEAEMTTMKDSTPAADPGEDTGTTITTDNQEKTSKLEDHERDPSEYIFIGDKKEQGWQYYPDMGFSLKLS